MKARGKAYLTFTDSFQRADLSAILHRVQGKVNLRHWLLLMNRPNGIIDLLILLHPVLIYSRVCHYHWLNYNKNELNVMIVELESICDY